MLSQKERIAQIERIEDTTILLDRFNEISETIADLRDLEEAIKFKLSLFLKKMHWDRYVDEKNHISVTLEHKQNKTVDWVQLKYYLKPNEIAQVTKITHSDVLNIVTPRMHMRMKEFVNRGEINV